MKWNHLAAAAAIALASVLGGCASVQKAGHDANDQAKAFTPMADKAIVYVYRDELLGAAIKMPVKVDDIVAGQTGPKSFLQLAVPPGHHVIASLSEKDATLAIDAEAGKTYYVWQEVKMGLMSARSALHLVSEQVGQAGVRKCDLLQTDAPTFRVPPSTGTVITPTKVVDAASTVNEPVDATANAATPVPAEQPVVSTASTPNVAAVQPEGGLAVLDARVDKPTFLAAEDVASRHQCERLLRVRSVSSTEAHFYSACPGMSSPLEITCKGSHCDEETPQG
ncbi:DUF2846 domain-containing protein [Luteibacter yeojuensis]